jgi:hypothetical protein
MDSKFADGVPVTDRDRDCRVEGWLRTVAAGEPELPPECYSYSDEQIADVCNVDVARVRRVRLATANGRGKFSFYSPESSSHPTNRGKARECTP